MAVVPANAEFSRVMSDVEQGRAYYPAGIDLRQPQAGSWFRAYHPAASALPERWAASARHVSNSGWSVMSSA
ncbi:hypothetical protein SAMN05445871_2962 [Paraburkholderia caballeronis]|uniref:Uncharacterized protein n=1 Tax=Paraburkholderia caballeronis TaxID=416943 RepID=A0A1H7R2F6_9BURK|nr:hypothetical protein C7403_109144 [Paraburkholderia caballeronis]PXW99032.1 hypothetical protein C7407_109144 [Paraburkholderia caballeronis]RAJ96238.1 hypothetical protein C7409_109144 [Paraburkholderia caballeronis]SEC83863.1 hypothetical protein SAMN05445871_2962 [Paraburkholderia caballeronis]SEL54441.1 hypothetical protein SAMN05192542_10982 [Paraburkholderia caballeronis]